MASKVALFLTIGSLVRANIIPLHGGGGGGGWPSFSWPWNPPSAPTCSPVTVTLPASTITLAISTVTLTITVGGGGSATTSAVPSSTLSATSITTSLSTSSSTSPSSTASIVDVVAASKSVPILDGFVSFSIEFAFFPDFAGNVSNPNVYSDNLLNNIGNITGTKPYIRVGGNTQDYALYDAALPVATHGVYVPSVSNDYPLNLNIGNAYFESYLTWPGVKFIHGFNQALTNNTRNRQLLLDTVPLACKALSGGKLAYWEFGNEPDLYRTSAQGIKRPANWSQQDYVNEWLTATRDIKTALQNSCPEDATAQAYKYYAPSFAGVNNNGLNLSIVAGLGLGKDSDIGIVSSHNYISGAASLGVTLQGTLMNHSSTINSVQAHVRDHNSIRNTSLGSLPYILGEHNSLYNQGRPGLSNTFGAALWGVDMNLYSASQNITRSHMHMGTNYRYQSWQPITTNDTLIGTKAPYYGNIAVAASLGNHNAGQTRVANLPLLYSNESAYAIYGPSAISAPDRIAVINMVQYNYTALANGTGLAYPTPKPSKTYSFQLPAACDSGASVGVRRLLANGSDSITGITWDGYSYSWELNLGKPFLLGNVTRGESVKVVPGGVVSVDVPYSSVAVLDLSCGA